MNRIVTRLCGVVLLTIPWTGCDDFPASPTAAGGGPPQLSVAGEYSRTELGSGVAVAINNRGQIAAWLKSDATCNELNGQACEYRAVLWESGTPTDLEARLYLGDCGEPVGPFYFLFKQADAGLDVNDRGVVVGSHRPEACGPYHAFRWHDGILESLFEGAGHAYAINDHDQIAVTLGTVPDAFEAAIWEGGHLTALGDLHGYPVIPRAINNREQVTGHSIEPPPWPNEPFLWQNGVMEYLGFGGGAFDIDDQGRIVGWKGHAGCPVSTGFIWTRGQFTDLGYLHDEQLETWAFAINKAGYVVGISEEGGGSAPFIWKNGTIYRLPGGADDFPLDINDRGQIVGYNCGDGCTGFAQVTALLWEVAR